MLIPMAVAIVMIIIRWNCYGTLEFKHMQELALMQVMHIKPAFSISIMIQELKVAITVVLNFQIVQHVISLSVCYATRTFTKGLLKTIVGRVK